MFGVKQYRFFMEVEVYHGPDWLFSRCKCLKNVTYSPMGTWSQKLPQVLDHYLQMKVEQYRDYYSESGLVSMRFVDAKSGEIIREYNKKHTF